MVMTEQIHYSNRDLDRWIRDTAQGDRDALKDLYRAAAPSVYAYALSILGNRYDAEDVLHDCFVTIQLSAGSYRPQDKPMAWIITITRNLCLKQLRSQKRTAPLPAEYYFSKADPSPEDKLIIDSCMTALGDEERQIVVLRAVAGFKFREIGVLLGLKTPTVLTKYRRAIQKLRSML